jgi:hypothetical protein
VFGGEGHSLFMRGRRTSSTQGWLTAGVASHRVPDALAWMASALPPTLPSGARSGYGCPFTARATVAPCAGPPHPRLLSRRRSYWWVAHGVGRCGSGGRVLVCPHSLSKDGSGDLQACRGSCRPPVQGWLSSLVRPSALPVTGPPTLWL